MEPLALDDPQAIGRYRLVGRLGAGGMGRVYLALSSDGRVVAVKVIHQQHVAEPTFRDRFRREVDAARRVSGAYTAAVMDADPDAKLPWLATVYVPGPSLRAAVRMHGPLPVSSVRNLAVGLAAALREVHRAGLVHRDLTPANVLLTDDGPRVIDFGITRAIETGVELTGTGLIIGSPGFMAPEQVEGHEATSAADVFSFGATLFFAAVGVGPFGKVSSAALLYRVVHTDPLFEQLPSELLPIVEPCLARKPELRPTPEQLLDRLGSVRGGLSWLPQPVRDRIEQQNEQLRVLRDGTEHTEAESADVTTRVDRSTASDRPAPVTRSHAQSEGPRQPQSQSLPPRWAGGATPVRGAAAGSGPAHNPDGRASGAGWGHVPAYFEANPPPASAFGTSDAKRPRNPAGYAFIILALFIVVTAVVASVIAITNRRDTAGDRQGSMDQPSAGVALPEVFIGQWTGWMEPVDEDPETYFHAVLEVDDGVVGDEVGTLLDFMSGCETLLELTHLADDTATFAPADADGQSGQNTCPAFETATLTFSEEGLLYYETDEPAFTSVLTRSLDEIPEELQGVFSGIVEGAQYAGSEGESDVLASIEIVGGPVVDARLHVEFADGCRHVSKIVYADPVWLAAEQDEVQGEGCPTVPAREVVHVLDPSGLGYNGTDPEMDGQLE